MKRKLSLIIALILALALALTACGNLVGIKVQGVQDTDYIVLSNGGSAVQYGNYIYFINGYNGYDDVEATSNVFNKVEKGGLYRAELVGRPVERTFDLASGFVTKKTFEPLRDAKTKFAFKTTTNWILTGYEKDEDGQWLKDEKDNYVEIREPVEYADVQKIGPKKIGTVGNPEGGIFVFDDYVFYASPNNTKDRNGKVQTHKTDFFRAKLDGSKTERIYTTEDTATSSPYMFYKYSGAYYLVVQEGDKVVSVKMDRKIAKPVTIGEGVSSVLFPNKGTYYKGMPENTADDFIYILRKPVRTDEYSDTTMIGNVLEARRPDGSHAQVIAGAGKTSLILGVHNGIFFYRIDNSIHYTNLDRLVNHIADDANYDDANYILGNFNFNASDYDSVRCVSPNPKNPEDVYIIGVKSDGMYLTDRVGSERRLYNMDSTIVAIDGAYLYFTSGVIEGGATVNKLLRLNMFVPTAEVEQILATDGTDRTATFKFDILTDFVMYFADIDNEAKSYAHFKELSDMSAEGLFVGYRISADTIPEESLYPQED